MGALRRGGHESEELANLAQMLAFRVDTLDPSVPACPTLTVLEQACVQTLSIYPYAERVRLAIIRRRLTRTLRGSTLLCQAHYSRHGPCPPQKLKYQRNPIETPANNYWPRRTYSIWCAQGLQPNERCHANQLCSYLTKSPQDRHRANWLPSACRREQ